MCSWQTTQYSGAGTLLKTPRSVEQTLYIGQAPAGGNTPDGGGTTPDGGGTTPGGDGSGGDDGNGSMD